MTLLLVLDYSIANIAIPYIAGGLAISEDQGIYVITFFAIGNAVGLAMTGWLVRQFGQVRTLLVSIALFTLFSFVCGFSFSLLMLIGSRFFQGLVAGPMIPLSQAFIIQEAPPGKKTRDIAIWSTIVITGPVLGPLLGGYISYWYNWSWIFYINIPTGIACFLILWILLRKKSSHIEKEPGDFLGMILLVIVVTCLQIFLDRGQEWDWWNSHAIRACFIGFVISSVFFVIRELGISKPFFQIRLLKRFSFSFANVLLFISYGIYFGSVVLIPLWLQEFMGYDAIRAGIAVCTLGIAPVLFSWIVPKVIQKVGNLVTEIISYLFFGISAVYVAFAFTTDIDLGHIGFSRFLMGCGFIFYITPLIQISIADIAPQELASATGIFHFFRALSGGVGASLFTTLWQRRTIFHHERIGSTVTAFNPMTPESSDLSSLQMLNDSLDQQASVLALNDAFYFMGWLYVIAIGALALYIFFVGGMKKAETAQIGPIA